MEEYTSEAFKEVYQSNTTLQRKKDHEGKMVERLYSDDIFVFDLEASSGWINDYGYIITFDECLGEEWYNHHEKLAIPYICQFGYNDKYYYKRELTDFLQVLEDLRAVDDSWKIIFIHNASYEWQWLLNICKDDISRIFARQERKLIYWEMEKYHVQIRCSYFLTNKSLALWGETLGIKKQIGLLDYNAEFRTPLTPLTAEELKYCEYDLRIMTAGLLQYRKEYGHVHNIPYTSTGEVRRDVKRGCKFYDSKKIAAMQPKTIKELRISQYIYYGGDTHTYAPIASKILGRGKSWDRTSAYPVEICYPMPMTPFRANLSNEIKDTEKYAYIICFKCSFMKSKYKHHYLSSSRLTIYHGGQGRDIRADNGRVITARDCVVWCTEIDFADIQKCYDLQDLEIVESYFSRKKYLPRYLVEAMFTYYGYKTSLKGLDDQQELYMKSKNKLNSLYGMCSTSLIMDTLEFVEGKFKIVEKDYQKQLDEYQEKIFKNFLSTYWGSWITSYARHHLWEVILGIEDLHLKDEKGKQVHAWYFDTDSVKVPAGTPRDFVEELNKKTLEQVEKCLAHYGLPKDLAYPKDKKGVVHPLGIWDFNDGSFSEACFLGAKRYVYRDEKDGKLHTTIAGVPKKDGHKVLHDDIRRFKDGLVFEYPDINKLLTTYIDGQQREFYYKGYHSKYKYAINMRPTSYTMDINSAYMDIIEYYANKEGIDEI